VGQIPLIVEYPCGTISSQPVDNYSTGALRRGDVRGSHPSMNFQTYLGPSLQGYVAWAAAHLKPGGV